MASLASFRRRGAALLPCACALAALASFAPTSSDPADLATRATATGATVAAAPAVGATGTVAAALPVEDAGADPLFVEPRVPRAAGVPCVVELFRDARFVREGSAAIPILYTPPPACAGPWSKVTLVLEVDGTRPQGNPAAHIEVLFSPDFASGEGSTQAPAIFVGAPAEHAGAPLWRLEHDVTDYAALFRVPAGGLLLQSGDNERYDFDDALPLPVTGKLLIYPATSQTPAQRVADVVRTVPANVPAGSPWPGDTFPRNIERAYVDVFARSIGGNHRYWWACVPTALAEAYPNLRTPFQLQNTRGPFVPDGGCTGGAFREVEVLLDGERVGVAPVFPWLPSDLLGADSNTLDLPAPSVQALNMQAFRVDVTPFAARLNDGAPHRVELVVAALEPRPTVVRGQLLLYLDAGRTQVRGAVVRNTLAGQDGTPAVAHTLVEGTTTNADGDVIPTLGGDIDTRLVRDYVAEGYVDTSKGRVRTRVWQRSRYVNTQTWSILGPSMAEFDEYAHDLALKIRLSSTLDRRSTRTRGGAVIADDAEYRSTPLLLDLEHGGQQFRVSEGAGPSTDYVELDVHQARGIRATHRRPGTPPYRTELADTFDGTYAWTGDGPTTRDSARAYRFTDAFGSCYAAALTTRDRVLQTRTRGVGCPTGRNALRWYARPGGEPVSMGWAPGG